MLGPSDGDLKESRILLTEGSQHAILKNQTLQRDILCIEGTYVTTADPVSSPRQFLRTRRLRRLALDPLQAFKADEP